MIIGGIILTIALGLGTITPEATVTNFMSYYFDPHVTWLHCHPSKRPLFECPGMTLAHGRVTHAYAIRAFDGCGRLLYALCTNGAVYMRYDAVTTQRKLARMIWSWSMKQWDRVEKGVL